MLAVGSQVVTRKDVQAANGRIAHPAGAVGVILKAPADHRHSYRVKFLDGIEVSLRYEQLVLLSEFKESGSQSPPNSGLFSRVIFRCVIGSQAYGL